MRLIKILILIICLSINIYSFYFIKDLIFYNIVSFLFSGAILIIYIMNFAEKDSKIDRSLTVLVILSFILYNL